MEQTIKAKPKLLVVFTTMLVACAMLISTLFTPTNAFAYNDFALDPSGIQKAGTSDYRIDYSKIVMSNADVGSDAVIHNIVDSNLTSQATIGDIVSDTISNGQIQPGHGLNDETVGYHVVVDNVGHAAHIFYREQQNPKARSVGDKIKPAPLSMRFRNAVISPTGEVGDLLITINYDNVELMQSRDNHAQTVPANKYTWYHAASIPTVATTKGIHIWSALCAPVTNADGTKQIANQTSTINKGDAAADPNHPEGRHGAFGTIFNILLGMDYSDIPSVSTKSTINVAFVKSGSTQLLRSGDADDFVLFFNDIDQDDESAAEGLKDPNYKGFANGTYSESVYPLQGFKAPHVAYVDPQTMLKVKDGIGFGAQNNIDDPGGEFYFPKAATMVTNGPAFSFIWKGNICGTYILQRSAAKLGRMQITKQAVGKPLEGKSFNMEVTFSGNNAPAKKTFSLKDGETYNINDIPLGVTAIVKETTTGDFDTTYTPSGANTQGVTISQGDTPVKVTVKNEISTGFVRIDKDLAF